MKNRWLRETARDFLALGGIPFYLLVALRTIIGDYKFVTYGLAISAIVIFILYFIIKNANLHIARSLAVLVFACMFYKQVIFTIFAGLIWVLLLCSAYYIERKAIPVFKGMLIGFVGLLIGYYGALML